MGYEVVAAAQQSGDDMGAQINAGIQYLKNDMGSGRVIIPPGIHTIKTEVLYEDNIWLRGYGRGATVLKLDEGYTPDNLISGASKSNLKISELTLDANSQEKHLLRFNACQEIIGESLGFKNAAGAAKGIYLDGASKAIEFRGLNFGSMPICIYLSSASFALFEGLYPDSLCGKLAYLVGAEVTDCELRTMFAEGLTTDIHLKYGVKRILIAVLKSNQAGERSIYIENDAAACEDVEIVDCEIQDASYSAANAFAAIHIEANHSRIRIINTMTINANAKQKYGVLIDAGASECEIRGGKHEGVTGAWLNNGTGTLIDSRR